MRTIAYIGLGSNQGDRLQNLAQALKHLDREAIVIEARSSVYETEPQGLREQPWFLNMVIRISTTLSGGALLKTLLSVESQMGRVRQVRWGPRIIDLDLLLFGDEVISEPDLEVPHPRLQERAFVLIPLLELDAAVRLPNGTLLKEYLPEAAKNQQVRLFKA